MKHEPGIPAITSGFQKGGNGGDLFKGAASYYSEYRRAYPAPVLSYITEEFQLDGAGRLLDAGCGTGQVSQGLAPYFEEAIAIDRDPEMVSFARKNFFNLGLSNVVVHQLPVEAIDESFGMFRIAAFGASFHWMDRVAVGNRVYDRLQPGGSIVVLSPGGFHSGITTWEAVIQDLVTEWVGVERRAGDGIYQEGERHEQALRRTHFGSSSTKDIVVQEDWSIDQIIGYLFSTSYASRAVLRDRAGGFENAVRQNLLQLRPDGQFQKSVEYSVISATRRH